MKKHPTAAECSLRFGIENILITDTENVADQDDLIGVQMTLSDLDFCNGTTGEVTPLKLKLGCQRVLRHAGFLTKTADILPDLLFDGWIHGSAPFPVLDFIINVCYNGFAPI